MAYEAPDVQDRVATGDDKYNITQLGGSKIQLTPQPDSVSVAGTDINKALLQPAFDAIQKLDGYQLEDYGLYYWLTRGISGYYSMVQDLAWKHGGYVSFSSSLNDRDEYIMYMFLNRSSGDIDSCQIQYANSVNISQTNGAVTLNNPTTRTFYRSDSQSSIEDILGNKYIMGLYVNRQRIYYVPADSDFRSSSWQTSGEMRTYYGYTWEMYGDETVDEGYGTRLMYVYSQYNSTNTPWSIISSRDPDTYPEDATVNGQQYKKLGRIEDIVLNYALENLV